MSSLGSRLRNVRIAHNLSLSELSSRSGVSKGTISLTERDKTSITSNNLEKLCRCLNVSAEFVLTGKNAPSYKDVGESAALKKVVQSIYSSGEISAVFAAFAALNVNQIRFLAKIAQIMTEESKREDKVGRRGTNESEPMA